MMELKERFQAECLEAGDPKICHFHECVFVVCDDAAAAEYVLRKFAEYMKRAIAIFGKRAWVRVSELDDSQRATFDREISKQAVIAQSAQSYLSDSEVFSDLKDRREEID
jgi:hypothetical protein